MRILITNDDGILAPGIQALYQAVEDLGEVDVVAPETTQSAMGHAISVMTPLLTHRVHVNNVFYGWSVDGRPADCVKLAMLELLDERPDFVLSGINAGANTANNVLYSGTVAGAVEAAFFGIPSMAVSLQLSDELNFKMAGTIARSIFRQYVASNPPAGMCLNVNIPMLERGWPKGVRVCPQSNRPMDDYYTKQTDPQGRSVYWLDGRWPKNDPNLTGDLAAVEEGLVAITPLRFDMTDHERLREVGGWKWPERFEEA